MARAERWRKVVVHRERRTEVGDRLIHEAHSILRLGEVLQDTGVPRLQRGRTIELDDRGGFLTGVQQCRAQPEVDLEAARAERVRVPEALERVAKPPLPHELGAELELLLVLARHPWSIAAQRLRVRATGVRPSMRDHSDDERCGRD